MNKLIDRLLRKRQRAAIRHFLQEAYLDHEITPGDYRYLLKKNDLS